MTRFVAELRRLREQAGAPSLSRLVGLSASLERPLRRSTISDKLNAKSLPEWDFVVSFVTACRMYAEGTGQPLPEDAVDLARWDAAHWRMLQAIDRVNAGELFAAAAKAEIGRRTANAAPTSAMPAGAAAIGAAAGLDPTTENRLTRVVPQQLPAAVRHFAGRTAELSCLDAVVRDCGGADAVAIVAIEGSAGVGKTTLAVRWAHRVAHRFPDGQLYVNLRGFNPTLPVTQPGEAILAFLDAFGVAAPEIPGTLEAQSALYRSLLAGRRVLIVLDNARDAEHVLPLLPGGPGCVVVVTSRSQLTNLVATHGAHWLALDLLSPPEARELLERQLGAARLAGEPAAVDDIINRCARLPLALSIVAARAATHPAHPLATLARELDHGHNRGHDWLDALDGGDAATDVRSVFSWSYRSLDPPAAGLFRLLGLHLGPDFAVPAAASLVGRPAAEVRRLLAELTRANLVTEHQPGRYLFHDVLRAYAAELAGAHDTEAARGAAVRRLLDHYLHTAHAASQVLYSRRAEGITPPALSPGVWVADLADHDEALAWFAVEHPAILAGIDLALLSEMDDHAYQIACYFSIFLTRAGRWAELIDTQRTALEAARRLSDRSAQADAHRSIALAAMERGDAAEAETHLRDALELHGELDDRTGAAATHLGFSRALELQGRHREALTHSTRAHDLYRAAGESTGQANALNSVGWCHTQLGEFRDARQACERALALVRASGDRWIEAATWDSLGYVHHHLADYSEATGCYRRAQELCHELGDRPNEAETLVHLGDTYDAAGDHGAARTAWLAALLIRTELNHPETAQIRTRLEQLDALPR